MLEENHLENRPTIFGNTPTHKLDASSKIVIGYTLTSAKCLQLLWFETACIRGFNQIIHPSLWWMSYAILAELRPPFNNFSTAMAIRSLKQEIED